MLIQERLQLILKMHQITPSVFADKIGVQRSNVSHVLSGRNKPGLDFLEKILLHFPRVNAHWLITGEVQNELNPPEESNNVGTHNLHMKPKEISKIVTLYSDGTFESYSPVHEHNN